jgi:hypothetical protein
VIYFKYLAAKGDKDCKLLLLVDVVIRYLRWSHIEVYTRTRTYRETTRETLRACELTAWTSRKNTKPQMLIE